MKILKPHPEFYRKYKDRVLQRSNMLSGVVVGYFIDRDESVILFVQSEALAIYKSFHYFVNTYKVEIEDYHGDTSKNFFLVDENDIEKKIVKLI